MSLKEFEICLKITQSNTIHEVSYGSLQASFADIKYEDIAKHVFKAFFFKYVNTELRINGKSVICKLFSTASKQKNLGKKSLTLEREYI